MAYFKTDTDIFEDKRLSNKAKGLAAYCLSRPPGWVIRMPDLIASSTDGRDAVQSGVRELIAAGYAQYVRAVNDKGRIHGQRLVVQPNREPGFPNNRKTRPLSSNQKTITDAYASGEPGITGFEPPIPMDLRTAYGAEREFTALGRKRGPENKLLFVIFWRLFGAGTQDPDWKLIGRLSKLRNQMEAVGIDGLSFLNGLYQLHNAPDQTFMRQEPDGFDYDPGFMEALPDRVLNYLTAMVTNKKKDKEHGEQGRSHTMESHEAVASLFR